MQKTLPSELIKNYMSISILILIFGGLIAQFLDFYFLTNFSSLTTILIYIIFIFLVVRYQILNLRTTLFLCISLSLLIILYFNVSILDPALMRSSLNVALFGIIFFNFKPEYLTKYMHLVNKFIYVFFVMNIILYLSKNPLYFKDMHYETVLRFKGVMPDAALFATVLEFIFIITLINIRSGKLLLPSILVIFLIFLTGSRTHSVISVALFCSYVFRFVATWKKIFIIFPCLFLGFTILSDLLLNSSSIERIISYNFYSNGRDHLWDSASQVFLESNFIEKLVGLNMTDRYLMLSSQTNFHSFGENSFLTMAMLYGLVGLIIYIVMWVLFFSKLRQTKNLIGVVTLILICITTFYEDTILSTQSFTFMIVSILAISDKKLNL